MTIPPRHCGRRASHGQVRCRSSSHPCTCLVQVPAADNYYAALNSAVFSDGSFCYVPKGVRCPMEVATYFRINAETSGQVL